MKELKFLLHLDRRYRGRWPATNGLLTALAFAFILTALIMFLLL